MKAICFPRQQTWEDESMRNVAFSILLFALAVAQIAIVSTELRQSHVQTAAASIGESGARIALASSQAGHKPSAF